VRDLAPVMPPGSQYLLPDGVSLATAQAALAAHLGLEAGAVRSVDRTFYDTFDGRLHAEGLLLTQEDGRLRLFHGAAERAVAVHSGRPQRLLDGDLPAGALRDLVAPVIDMRALTPIVRIQSRLQPLRALDADAKTVVRILFEEPSLVSAGGRRSRLQPRLHVSGVRGYGKALALVRKTLEDELGLPTARRPLHDDAVTATGGSPGGVSSRLGLALRPGQRADSAATTLLLRLLRTIEQNLPGTLADVDSEFLHDLRVGVRRTRSAQRQLRGVFPPEPLARFREEFRWLQQVTGPTRDLDVYLLELDEFRAGLPEALRPDLEPLRGLLQRRRAGEQRRMVRALRSARAGSIAADWSTFLSGLVASPPDDRPDAGRTIAAVAGERIAAVYWRIVKAGGAIGDASPPEALHELRKTGKELRYLLEFFAGLYPGTVVKPMIRTLKGLQDTLGRFQDREVQAHMLHALRDEVAVLDRGPAALMAMGLLVDRLEADQAAARSEFAERFEAFAARRQRALVRETFA
jgi:CHAD domain-containing protein